MNERLRQFKGFVKQHECIILSLVVIIIVGCSTYSFGLLKGAALQKESIKISVQPHEVSQLESVKLLEQTFSVDGKKDCAFVGSVNGSKYYPPNCPSVKRINPQNLTCFSSAEDAQQKGYTRTTSCK